MQIAADQIVKAVREADRGNGAQARTVARIMAYPWKVTPAYVTEVTTRLNEVATEGLLSKTGSKFSVAR